MAANILLAQTPSILVDDTDPNISYTGGPWTEDATAFDNQGMLGRPLFQTLHGSSQSAGITYLFNGTKVIAAGAFRNTTSGAVASNWTCFVDGLGIPTVEFPSPQNGWPLCVSGTLADGLHNITVVAQATPEQEFWFDYFQYTPSSKGAPSDDNAVLSIDSSDRRLEYDGTWEIYSSGNMTTTPGSSLTVTFHGTSVIWNAITPKGSSSLPATIVTYTIDGNITQESIRLPSEPSSTVDPPDLYNQILFQTPDLPVAVHTLRVVYNGNAQSAPLVLDSIIVQNPAFAASPPATSPSVFSSPSPSPSPSPTPTGSGTGASGSSKHGNLAVIIGSVLGGAAVLGLGLLLIVACRRRTGWKLKRPGKRRARWATAPVPYAHISDSSDTSPSALPPPYSKSSQTARRA